ncbi:MAG: response regulator [Verrucomicrobiota bacterium]
MSTSNSLEHASSGDAPQAMSQPKLRALVCQEIRGLAEAVPMMVAEALTESMSPSLRVQLNAIHSKTRALASMTNSILSSRSRVESLPVTDMVFDTRHELESALESVRRIAVAKNLEFDLKAPAFLWALGDAAHFKQIVFNLASNAVKFTESGFVEIRLVGSEEGLQLVVRDSGPGMSPEAIEQHFPTISEEYVTLRETSEGTGLGFVIVRYLVGWLGGSITARSVLGSGATFRVNLPMRCISSPESDSRAGQSTKKAQLNLRILLAEDTKISQLIAKAVLDELGCVVTTASNGLEVLAKASGQDVILMDRGMPFMDGVEATRRLRGAGCNLPIIALTANANERDRLACLSVGMNGFLAKPLEERSLRLALEPYSATLR